MKDPIERFMSNIQKESNGCWIWTGGTSHSYGSFYFNGYSRRAHRFSYEHFRGVIPKGKNVCYGCGTPYCVNPNHLYLGVKREFHYERPNFTKQPLERG